MVLPLIPEEEQLVEWDETRGEYIALAVIVSATGAIIARAGEAVAYELVLDAIEFSILSAQTSMRSLGAQLQSGSINLAQWQAGMMQEIKILHTASAAVSRGGWQQMAASDWGWVGSEIKKQYQYLDGFANDIFAGLPLDGRFLQRLDLYGRAGRTTASQINRRMQDEKGFVEERRILGAADHCNDSAQRQGCLELAAMGWQPIGTLPEIGGATCHQNCRCHFVYR
jgi:hypothetical protein